MRTHTLINIFYLFQFIDDVCRRMSALLYLCSFFLNIFFQKKSRREIKGPIYYLHLLNTINIIAGIQKTFLDFDNLCFNLI